jgi:archaellum biogenesis ATPase FlaH
MVRHWWDGEPDANIGIRTGTESGVVVVDIDPRHGGLASLQEMQAKHGALPPTVVVRTGGQGWHYFFRHPGGYLGNRQSVLPGIDVRGDGGYIVAPPSNHVAGDYLFEPGFGFNEIAVAEMPAWLRELVTGPAQPAATTSAGSETISSGERNGTLFSMACSMRSKGLSRAGIEAAIRAENATRCSPPLPDADITRIVASATRYPAGATPRGKDSSAAPREEVLNETILAFETAANPRSTAQSVQWVVHGYVAVGAMSLITGKPKLSGKSTFTLHMLAKVLDGQPFAGMTTTKTGVVYLTEERTSFTELLKRAGVLGREDFTFLRYDPSRQATFSEMVIAARRVAKQKNAKVLIVDTMAQFMALPGDSENDAGTALEALKPLQEAAQDGLAVVILHHEKKGGADVGDAGRGSGAFLGAVDVIMSLRRPEGQTSPQLRVLHALSRYNDTPDKLFLELTDHGYEAREEGGIANAAAEEVILQNAQTIEEQALTIADLIAGSDIKKTTAHTVVKKLVADGKLMETGEGVRGNPHRYWKA